MSMTDPIADLLTRIRNGHTAAHQTVDVPASKLKGEIVRILKEEGYIDGFEVVEKDPQDVIKVALKYTPDGQDAIAGIQRVSRPGRRSYCGKGEIPKVLNGLGVAVLSTSRGVMTGRACEREGLGGEILLNVW